MSLEFKYYKIDDIGEVVSGGTPSTSKDEYWYGDIGWITPKDLSTYDDIYISRGERNISSEGLNNSSAKLVPKNTILMTSRAPIGYIAIANNELSTNQGFKSLICDEKICHYKYFYYWLKLNIKYIINNANGSTFNEISGGTFKNLEISLPSITEQKVISSVLWTLDEKISVLKKINKNLVTLAKTIFRDKFIFYKGYESQMIKTDVGEIPNTFEVKSVDEISKDVVCGKTPSTKVEENYGDKMPFITIPDMHGNVFVIDTERKLSEIGIKSQIKKILPENSICVSCIATAGLVSLTSEESQTNQQINSIICKEDISPYFVYLYMEELSEYIKMLGSGGSTTLNLNKREFGKIELVIPPQDDMIEFHGQISPLFEKIKSNQYEINFLMKLRDTLLPKLMSGEIDVSQINCDEILLVRIINIYIFA